MQVSCHGQRHLSAAIGTRLFTEEYVSKKVKSWLDEILALSSIAETHLHSAYCALILFMVWYPSGIMQCELLNRWALYFNHWRMSYIKI